MAIRNEDLYRTNASGTVVVVDGKPMLENRLGDQLPLDDMLTRFEGKEVRIDIVDTSKEKGRTRRLYGSQPR